MDLSKWVKKINIMDILGVFVPLLAGILVYVLLRTPIPLFRRFISSWNHSLIDISALPIFLEIFIKFHLPDILWALSFYALMKIILLNTVWSFSIVMITASVFEFLQYIAVVRGTGDVWDVFYIACSLTIYILFFRGKKKHEQKA